MAAKRGLLPSYRLHQASGQAVVTIEGRMFYLGLFDYLENCERYDRLLGEWQARGRYLGAAGLLEAGERKSSPGRPPAVLSVDDLLAAYWKHASEYYRKDGRPTSELSILRLAGGYLHRLYGSLPAAEFGPLKLKAIREQMIDEGLARSTVNGFVARIKQTFRWGVENEVVPAAAGRGDGRGPVVDRDATRRGHRDARPAA